MAGTTIYNQEFGAKIWQESNEGKAISDTRDTKISARTLENPEDKVSPKVHETYRSEVGTLLYFTKHSSPDICNQVRELSKTMDAPAPAKLKKT